MSCACPRCGCELEFAVIARAPVITTEIQPEEWLEPGIIADRLGICEAHCRKLINRGRRQGLPGFKKPEGRLFATVDAVRAIRAR